MLTAREALQALTDGIEASKGAASVVLSKGGDRWYCEIEFLGDDEADDRLVSGEGTSLRGAVNRALVEADWHPDTQGMPF